MRAILFAFLALIAIPLFGQSNEGTEFWLGFMEHRDELENTKVVMITSKRNTSGTVSIPRRGWSQPFAVSANDVVLIELPLFAETLGSEFVNDNAILIKSEDLVSVYMHQYFGFRSEATIVLPTVSLGTSYFAMTYKGIFWQNEIFPPEMLIVAAKDETTITITPSAVTEKGKSAGVPFNVTIDKGEVYQIRAREWDGDFTGSYVEGDKKFALFAGTSWSEVPTGCNARDNLLEQMYPISTLGEKFVTVPNANLSSDLYRVLATEDNTNISVQSTATSSYALNRGQYVEYELSQAAYIEADKPVLVAQYLKGSDCNGYNLGDPSFVIMNSVQQIRDTVTLFNSSFQNIIENYINIITRTIDIGLVSMDGQNLVQAGQIFTPVGNTGEFSYVNLKVGVGAHTIISEGCGVIASAYGYGNLESYAYSGGASFSTINRNPLPEGGCLNDTVFFDAQLSPDRYTFLWDLGDEIRTEPAFTKFYSELGVYPASVIITDLCLNEVDTFYRDMLISLRQAVLASDDILICENESIELTATDLEDAVYEWVGPLDYFSEDQFSSIKFGKPEMSGTYAVIGIVSGCATFPSFTEVEVIPTPNPVLGSDSVICTKDEMSFIINPGNFVNYVWQDNSTSSIFEVGQEGIYTVEVSDEYGCIGIDSVIYFEQCPTVTYLPNVFSPNFDGANDFFGLLGDDIIEFELKIYDRWGGLVFKSQSLDDMWDGRFNGADVPVGVYVYTLDLMGYAENGTRFRERTTGDITLVR